MKQPEVTPQDICSYARILLTSEPAASRDPAAALRWAKAALERGSEEDAFILTTLAMAYHGNGDLDKAVELQRKVVEMLQARPMGFILQGWNRDTMIDRHAAERRLIRYLFHKGEDEEAERIFFDCIRRYTETRRETYSMAKHLRGDVYMLIEEGRYALAESLLLKVHEIFTVVPGSFSGYRIEVMENTISLYESMGQHERAEEWRAKLKALAPNHIKD